MEPQKMEVTAIVVLENEQQCGHDNGGRDDLVSGGAPSLFRWRILTRSQRSFPRLTARAGLSARRGHIITRDLPAFFHVWTEGGLAGAGQPGRPGAG
jgi:hypothetical protein